jgi:hypothetical protein
LFITKNGPGVILSALINNLSSKSINYGFDNLISGLIAINSPGDFPWPPVVYFWSPLVGEQA